MHVLVTGAGGFAGRHLVSLLTEKGHNVIALDAQFISPLPETGSVQIISADLTDAREIEKVVLSSKPDACVHLGAISFVPDGLSNPDRMLSVNIRGTMNVLNAFQKHARTARILVVSTSQVYGSTTEPKPITEDAPLLPVNMYGISKAAADIAALACAKKDKMHIVTVRPSNHTGPGQSPMFVIPSFVSQLMAIKSGKQKPVILVGNLESVRNFADVRDIVHAYVLLLEKGRNGQAYNVSANNALKISVILDTLCDLTGIKPELKVDPEKVRPTDKAPFLDITKLIRDTAWQTRIPFMETLRDMITEAAE